MVDDELARAIRHESAAALRSSWGASEGVVWRWPEALVAGRVNCEGSQRLVRATPEQGARAEEGVGRRPAARAGETGRPQAEAAEGQVIPMCGDLLP